MKEKAEQLLEPTKAELEILEVLWQNGPSTVRFINDQLNSKSKAVRYTTTLKLMQIMIDKKMLLRDESQMKHVYKAIVEESKTKSQMLQKFTERLYNGSPSKLMMQLLGNKKTSQKEWEAIRKIISDFDKGLK